MDFKTKNVTLGRSKPGRYVVSKRRGSLSVRSTVTARHPLKCKQLRNMPVSWQFIH